MNPVTGPEYTYFRSRGCITRQHMVGWSSVFADTQWSAGRLYTNVLVSKVSSEVLWNPFKSLVCNSDCVHAGNIHLNRHHHDHHRHLHHHLISSLNVLCCPPSFQPVVRRTVGVCCK